MNKEDYSNAITRASWLLMNRTSMRDLEERRQDAIFLRYLADKYLKHNTINRVAKEDLETGLMYLVEREGGYFDACKLFTEDNDIYFSLYGGLAERYDDLVGQFYGPIELEGDV